MKTCKTCKWWGEPGNGYTLVNYCKNPKSLSYDRAMASDDIRVDRVATDLNDRNEPAFITGPYFGCIHHADPNSTIVTRYSDIDLSTWVDGTVPQWLKELCRTAWETAHPRIPVQGCYFQHMRCYGALVPGMNRMIDHDGLVWVDGYLEYITRPYNECGAIAREFSEVTGAVLIDEPQNLMENGYYVYRFRNPYEYKVESTR